LKVDLGLRGVWARGAVTKRIDRAERGVGGVPMGRKLIEQSPSLITGGIVSYRAKRGRGRRRVVRKSTGKNTCPRCPDSGGMKRRSVLCGSYRKQGQKWEALRTWPQGPRSITPLT